METVQKENVHLENDQHNRGADGTESPAHRLYHHPQLGNDMKQPTDPRKTQQTWICFINYL